jgi:hypothetical protein
VHTLIAVADAVVARLNDGAFTGEFTAARAYQPALELADLKTLHVTVVPKALTLAVASRAEGYFECAVDIAVQKKLSTANAAELDGLMDVVARIIDHLRGQRLAALPSAVWLSLANEPVFAPEHLEQWRQFTSLITVTYRVKR